MAGDKVIDVSHDVLALFRKGDPHTSREAAEFVSSSLPYRRYVVYKAIERHGKPLMHHELVKLVPEYGPSGVRTRCHELEEMGFVRRAGLGKSLRGRPSIKWDIYRGPLD